VWLSLEKNNKMEIIEIETPDGTKWQCVQALEGLNGNLAEKAEKITGGSENVTVVCTPQAAHKR
jgi:hypothetical protein